MASIASVHDADLLAGVWYVLDRANSRVHRLDADGELLGSFGGEGDGPGEFRSPLALAVHGDTVVVVARRRLHLYESDGLPVQSRRLEPPENCLRPSLSDVAPTPAGLLLLYVCGPRAEVEAVVMLEVDEASYRHIGDLSAVVSSAPAIFFADGSVLAAWDELEGTRIAVYDTGG